MGREQKKISELSAEGLGARKKKKETGVPRRIRKDRARRIGNWKERVSETKRCVVDQRQTLEGFEHKSQSEAEEGGERARGNGRHLVR